MQNVLPPTGLPQGCYQSHLLEHRPFTPLSIPRQGSQRQTSRKGLPHPCVTLSGACIITYESVRIAYLSHPCTARLSIFNCAKDRPYRTVQSPMLRRSSYCPYGRLTVFQGFYCMPEEGVELTPKPHLLSDDEVVRLAKMFVKQGVTKIRLTGGEPTVRKGVVELIGKFTCSPPAPTAISSVLIRNRQIEWSTSVRFAFNWYDEQRSCASSDDPSIGGKRVNSPQPQVKIIHTSHSPFSD